MKHMFLVAAALAATFANFAAAQTTCPKTKANTVPLDVQFFGMVKCGTVNITIGGATFSGPNQGCPLLAVRVPAHEVEVPQTNNSLTKTNVWAQVTTEVYHFTCKRDYLLFLPWDSTCTLERRAAGAVLPRMSTVPCDPTPPVTP